MFSRLTPSSTRLNKASEFPFFRGLPATPKTLLPGSKCSWLALIAVLSVFMISTSRLPIIRFRWGLVDAGGGRPKTITSSKYAHEARFTPRKSFRFLPSSRSAAAGHCRNHTSRSEPAGSNSSVRQFDPVSGGIFLNSCCACSSRFG